MAARDRYQSKIKCPKCGAEGVLHISENDYPFMNSVDKKIDSIEGNFSTRLDGPIKVIVICGKCGQEF